MLGEMAGIITAEVTYVKIQFEIIRVNCMDELVCINLQISLVDSGYD